ncbi:MAG: FAD-linked oxidase C-terminal domain-containing protein, partial [Microvirga sp.]
LAQSEAQAAALWHLRFAVSQANRDAGPSLPFDVSVAVENLPAFIAGIEGRLAAEIPATRAVFVGHAADGNMHVTVLLGACAMADREAAARRARAVVYESVVEHRGSLSAEHGIGRTGREAFAAYGDPTERALMQAIKRAFDPAGILNPGILF